MGGASVDELDIPQDALRSGFRPSLPVSPCTGSCDRRAFGDHDVALPQIRARWRAPIGHPVTARVRSGRNRARRLPRCPRPVPAFSRLESRFVRRGIGPGRSCQPASDCLRPGWRWKRRREPADSAGNRQTVRCSRQRPARGAVGPRQSGESARLRSANERTRACVGELGVVTMPGRFDGELIDLVLRVNRTLDPSLTATRSSRPAHAWPQRPTRYATGAG